MGKISISLELDEDSAAVLIRSAERLLELIEDIGHEIGGINTGIEDIAMSLDDTGMTGDRWSYEQIKNAVDRLKKEREDAGKTKPEG